MRYVGAQNRAAGAHVDCSQHDLPEFIVGLRCRSGSVLNGRWRREKERERTMNMLVREVMSPDVVWVAPSETIWNVASKMKEFDIGAVPVCENNEIIGIVTDRDIVVRGLVDDDDIAEHSVREVMTLHPVWCSENEDVEDAIRLMEEKQIRRLPVVDSEKHLIGLLSLGDVSQNTSHELSGEVIAAVSRHSSGSMTAM